MRARAQLRQAPGIPAAPALARAFRWPKAMPQYPRGHLARVETLERAGEAVLELDAAPLGMGARAGLREALGITAAPALARVFRWPKAMPQYHVGHLARVETIERRAGALPGLDLAGGAYRGVGIADCVRSGEAAAERALGAGAV